MVKPLRVLMASWEEVAEPIFRAVIEEGGHQLTIMSPWRREVEFLEEAKTGQYDVILLTNLGLPLDCSLGLIAPLHQSCSAKVIVMSGAAGQEDREMASKAGACAFHQMPMPVDKLLEAVEAAARE